MTGAVKGGICLCLAKSHNHNAIIITWGDVDSNPNSAMLCGSGRNQLMSIQGFQMSFFLGHSFSQSRRNGIKHSWKVASCLPQSYLEPQKWSIPTATGLLFERQNQKGSLEEGDSLCFSETGVIDLLLQAQQHFIRRVCTCSTESSLTRQSETRLYVRSSVLSWTEWKRLNISLKRGFQLLGFVTLKCILVIMLISRKIDEKWFKFTSYLKSCHSQILALEI